MSAIESDVEEYLLWLGVHNYAKTTIGNRNRYLEYLVRFLAARGVTSSVDVTFELLKEYQEELFTHRKINGQPLSFGTQAQRLIPVRQFFSWMRRTGLMSWNPAADLSTPRPDRRLPEATLSAAEMTSILSRPDV